MDLLGMELAGFLSLHQLDCVVECRRPVEPAAERLAHQGAGRGVVPTLPTMYVRQQLKPLFPGDA